MKQSVRLHADAEVLSGPGGFLLMDHRTGKCLVLGAEERYLLHLLEKTVAKQEVCEAFESRFGETITPGHIDEFVENLYLNGVLDTEIASEDAPQAEQVSEEEIVLEDPFSLSTRGGKLNFAFDILVLLFGWILNPWCLIPVAILMWMAANVVNQQGGALVDEHLAVLGHYHIAFYLIFILMPKHFLLSCVEATLTGMVCRRFGGRIRGAGIRMRLGLLPAFQAAYDDSILMLPKRGRITFMTIGIWSVLAIGSLAIIGASVTPRQSELHVICLLLVLPCLVRLVIVCNVFFRFSGLYLLLVDSLGERRLMDDAIEETGRWLTWQPSVQPMSERRRFWLRAYGLGYFAYRFVISVLILWAGWHVSTNSMGMFGLLLTMALFIYFNYDVLTHYRAQMARKRPPVVALTSSTISR